MTPRTDQGNRPESGWLATRKAPPFGRAPPADVSGPSCPQAAGPSSSRSRRCILRAARDRRAMTLAEAARRARRHRRRRCAAGRRTGSCRMRATARWTPAAVAHARIVARLRERGHSLDEIREARESGRLAFGYIEDLLPGRASATHTLEEAAERDRARARADRAHLDRRSASPPTSLERHHRRRPRSCCATSPRCWRPASRSSPSCSSCASTARRSRRSPTPRSGSSTSTSTSR